MYTVICYGMLKSNVGLKFLRTCTENIDIQLWTYFQAVSQARECVHQVTSPSSSTQPLQLAVTSSPHSDDAPDAREHASTHRQTQAD